MEPPTGCKFHPRCAHAMDVCRRESPVLREIAPGHHAACHLLGRG
jgi:oligopeptide/dipeptide ABC transporter ATP-binding protein